MRTLVAAITFALTLGSVEGLASKSVKEYSARSVKVLSNSAVMHYHKDYFITTVSGVVGSEGIPEVINVGDEITVKDQTMKANLIKVVKYLKDMVWQKHVFARKGDIICIIAETEKDFPWNDERDRVWINVEKCLPLR